MLKDFSQKFEEPSGGALLVLEFFQKFEEPSGGLLALDCFPLIYPKGHLPVAQRMVELRFIW